MKAPIFAISRLRMGTDGSGITTLITFMGCPLKCKYCLNQKCHEPIYETDGKTLRKGIMMLTPQELYDIVKVDNIYFQSTGGGICFGGGETTLKKDFIDEFIPSKDTRAYLHSIHHEFNDLEKATIVANHIMISYEEKVNWLSDFKDRISDEGLKKKINEALVQIKKDKKYYRKSKNHH